ncbi:MAG TPA: phenylalanine--tRNA ligase subunit beta [Acidimicrobiia bacterium]|nr:phenylalanine--tRNA ligase subunit beta [Acidimicrobiia bacterium]
MKLTLAWLREFVAIPEHLDGRQLAEIFESLGHEVEGWKPLEPGFEGVVVGKVLDVSPHPNADKVRLTRVDVGTEELEIICGAWNFEAGAIVPVAVPGAVLGGDFTIVRREIRGVTSNGMICSEAELGLGDDSDGIMVLDSDYREAARAIGTRFETIVGLPDVWFEVNVTPDRPDCLSVYGLARDVAAYLDLPLRDPLITVSGDGPPTEVRVVIDAPDANPRFAGRQVRGITVGPSPHWMRWRITQAGMRPISNVVDASNYAMVEFGHPTHAFDVDRLGTHLGIRMANPGEKLITLDDQERTLAPNDIVVTDGTHPVALAGVMGGASTEVDATTTNVFIEAAYWDPASILVTSKRLNLRSEASARFERGADPSFCALGADRVAQLLEQIAGGTAASTGVDEDPGSLSPWTIRYPLSETRRILGIDLDASMTASLLQRLGFGVDVGDPIVVTVPTRRPDVRRTVDLVEEIARLHGFDAVPDTVPQGPGLGLPFRERRLRAIREIMVGAGFHETLSFSFVGARDLESLGFAEGHPVRSGIPVVNPLNEGEGIMRTTLLPGVLKSAAANLQRRLPSVRLFEIGKVFLQGAGKLPEQPDRMAFIIAGTPEATWHASGSEPDIFDGTGAWQLLADKLGIPHASVRASRHASFHPGRCADILVADTVVGTVGEIHPSVVEAFGLTGRVVGAEMELVELLIERGPWQYVAPSTYPPVIFDLAFAMDESVPAGDVLDVVANAAGPYLEDVRVFDVFRGPSIGEGRKSIALALRLRAPDRTLTEDEAGPVRRAIAEAVRESLGAELRGSV